MKNRVLSAILTASLAVGMCPSAAWASEVTAATDDSAIACEEIAETSDETAIVDATDEGLSEGDETSAEDAIAVDVDDVDVAEEAEEVVVADEDPAAVEAVGQEATEEVAEVEATESVVEAEPEDVANADADEDAADAQDKQLIAASTGNDSKGKATSISVNKAVSAKMVDAADEDWYKFTLSSAGVVNLTWSNDYAEDGGGWRVRLYGVDTGALADYRFQADHEKAVTCDKMGLPAGTYYVRIETLGFTDASYTLTVKFSSSSVWEREPTNDTKSGATSIKVNTAYHGTSRNDNDEDWYKFKLDAAGYIYLTWTNTYADEGSWRAHLYGVDTGALQDYTFKASREKAVTCGKIGLPAGTYYIKVDSQSYTGVQYDLKVNFVESAQWESEPGNDTKAGATALSTRTKKYGSMRTDSDEDWYKFTLPKACDITLTWDNKNMGISDGWRVYLFGEGDDSLGYYQFQANKKTQTTAKKHLQAGTYYLRVDSYGYTNIPYRFSVNAPKVNISTATITNIKSQRYTGKAITPKVTVKVGSTTLIRDADYTVTYANNVQLGTATVTIKGLGAYTGSVTKTFKIIKGRIADATVSSIKKQGYTGSAIEPKVTVKAAGSGKLLNEGKSYTLSYSNNKARGTATVTIKGQGNFTGTKTVTFKIVKSNINKATVSKIAKQYYTGAAITPTPTVKMAGTLSLGKSYTLTYENNKAIGTATVTITGKGNYTGTVKTTFKIAKGNISKATVVKIANQSYTGSAIRPELTVKAAGSGKVINEGKSYTVAYKNNKARGTATVTITGMGNFTGSKTVTFRIV